MWVIYQLFWLRKFRSGGWETGLMGGTSTYYILAPVTGSGEVPPLSIGGSWTATSTDTVSAVRSQIDFCDVSVSPAACASLTSSSESSSVATLPSLFLSLRVKSCKHASPSHFHEPDQLFKTDVTGERCLREPMELSLTTVPARIVYFASIRCTQSAADLSRTTD